MRSVILSAHDDHKQWISEAMRHGSWTDLHLVGCDGSVWFHKVALAPLSSFLRDLLHADHKDTDVTLLLPDVAVKELRLLNQLIYNGITDRLTCREVSGLKELTKSLKMVPISATVVDLPGQLGAEHTCVPTRLPHCEEAPPAPAVRRSARARVRSSKLVDHVAGRLPAPCPANGHKWGSNVVPPKQLTNTCEQPVEVAPVIREKRINDVSVQVLEPDSEAFEVKSQGDQCGDIMKQCLICDKKLFGKYAFAVHLTSTHSQGGPFSCPSCETKWQTGVKLHQHHRTVHRTSSDEKLDCPHCAMQFSLKASFLQHVRLKHGGVAKKKRGTFTCPVKDCSATVFTCFSSLQKHTLAEHNLFPLECHICHKRYKEQQTLRNHLETHFGERKYPCDVCGKKFVTKERLCAHRRLHLGKRFVCSKCGFCGRSGSALRTHIQMKHQEPRFECILCTKRFGSKQNLELHQRTHIKYSPWSCELCNLHFKRLHHFKSHLTTNSHMARMAQLKSQGINPPKHLNSGADLAPSTKTLPEDVPEVKQQTIESLLTKGFIAVRELPRADDDGGSKAVTVLQPSFELDAVDLDINQVASSSFHPLSLDAIQRLVDEESIMNLTTDQPASRDHDSQSIFLECSTSASPSESVRFIIVEHKKGQSLDELMMPSSSAVALSSVSSVTARTASKQLVPLPVSGERAAEDYIAMTFE